MDHREAFASNNIINIDNKGHNIMLLYRALMSKFNYMVPQMVPQMEPQMETPGATSKHSLQLTNVTIPARYTSIYAYKAELMIFLIQQFYSYN